MDSQKEANKTESVFELSKQLRDLLDDLLNTGDWKSSLFLKTAAASLKELREKSEALYQSGKEEASTTQTMKDTKRKTPPKGYTQAFILLYQADGANLSGWYRTVKTIEDYSITRPIYDNEEFVKEFIRAKTTNPDRNGYVVVNIRTEDYLDEEHPIDQFGHSLCVLKQGAVKLENVVEFVHNNKKRYLMGNSELVYLGEI